MQDYNQPKKLLITGGAGFIGSNLVESFINSEEFSLIRVLDNLSSGYLRNIESFMSNPKFEFINGDIRDKTTTRKACEGIDLISHHAALGSVPRSINDPITSTEVNVNGFLNILWAAKEFNIKRIVYASSSSVYGDLTDSPKKEDRIGKVLSPYAANKMCNELFAEAFARNYDMDLIGLRYFNVFGPKQDPDSSYAAVIPLFFKAALNLQSPIIYGDGSISRDFTPVKNVIQMNYKVLLSSKLPSRHTVLNIACGQTTTLNNLWEMIEEVAGIKVAPYYGAHRKGDVYQSLADISLARKAFDYNPTIDLTEELKLTFDYYKNFFK
jgi:UDP-N-acetylglucosamine 4-epimerase